MREVFWGTEGVHVIGVGVEVERGEQGQEKVGGETKGDSKFSYLLSTGVSTAVRVY